MRRPLLAVRSLCVAALLATLAACSPARAAVAVGEKAPLFSLEDLDGKTVSLADFRGKVVVLEWMNPNCPFSRGHAERGTMTSTAAKHAEVVWLGINSTNPKHPDFVSPADFKRYDEKNGIRYPVLYDPDGATGHAYGARTTPNLFVIDKDGTVAYEGAIDDSPSGAPTVNYVDAALSALEAGKRPAPAVTKPYGCSVKY